LLYITFIDFNAAGSSGSSVRPQKMYEAFGQLGIQVKMLQGQQNRRQQRKKRVHEIINWLDTNRPDLCYVEPPSGPFFNYIDHVLLRKLHRMKVPIGLFYRDMFWKFGLGDETPGVRARLKKIIVAWMHRFDWWLFMKHLSILYFPTQAITELKSSQIPVKVLPPGCYRGGDEEAPYTNNNVPVGIYVGGTSEIYGLSKLLRAAWLLYDQGVKFRLKLICRKPEWDEFVKINGLSPLPSWLEILHISGDQALSVHYTEADFALCPHRTGGYGDVTFSVKIMEYLSYLKPVVVTATKPMKNLVENYHIGIVTKDTEEDFAHGMRRMIEDIPLRDEFRKNCIRAREENLWIFRAQTVLEDLTDLTSMQKQKQDIV
ncbi:MAG: glycosyltransferase, partial [Firmicutes bacterium]|nr:glycosyltransferase [Bacillota bacterium]